MRISRAFQPITLVIEREEEARILEDALNLLVKDCMRRGGSTWFGLKDVKLKPNEMEYRALVKRILVEINPRYKESTLFVTEWA